MNDAGHNITDKILDELEKRVAEEYRIAQEDMKKKLKDYLAQYRVGLAEQKQLLKDGKITNQEYTDWYKRHIAMGKRWSDMRDVLAHDYHNANQIAMKMAYDTQKDVYAINRNYATYQVEHDAMIDTSYTLYDRDTVERILRDNPKLFHDPGTKKQREIAKNKDLQWNKQKVNSAILQGILQGESIEKLANRLESVTEKNYNAAVRNVRTAVTGAQNAGRVDGYKRAQDLGIDLMQEWMATLDNRTRHEHRLLHGQRVKVGEPFIIDGHKLMYPGDPNGAGYLVYNCRCTLISQIKGFESAKVEKSPKMGGLTFEQWQNAKAPKKPKETKTTNKTSSVKNVNLGDKLTKSLGADAKIYEDVIINADDNVAKIYNNYSSNLKDCVKDGDGYYSPYLKAIHWGESYHGSKWSTLAHEYGHFADNEIELTAFNSNEVDYLNTQCPYFMTIFKKVASSSDEFLSAMRADRVANIGFIKDSVINDTMKKDLMKNSGSSSGVQDAFDGFWGTQNSKDKKTRLPWGHGDKYYNRKYNTYIVGNGLEKKLKDAYKTLGFDASNQAKVKTITRDYETASELWANITSAKTVGGEELKYMEKYFPNAVKAWDSIVGGV